MPPLFLLDPNHWIATTAVIILTVGACVLLVLIALLFVLCLADVIESIKGDIDSIRRRK